MKRIVILVTILLTAFAAAQSRKTVYYDQFSQHWLDPAKWTVGTPECNGTLECVREIQDGRLRVALRNFGTTDSDSGDLWSFSQVHFTNPNAINSITTDVILRSFRGTQCSTNSGFSHTQVEMGGNYFNTGSGSPLDDVGDLVFLWVDPFNPKTIRIGNYLFGPNLSGVVEMGSYPIGTPLTVTIAWDKANRQFISIVKVKDDGGPGNRVVIPYSVPDTTPPGNPLRYLDAGVNSPNCTGAQQSARVEAFYDNVIINQ